MSDTTVPGGRHTPAGSTAQPETLTPLLRDRESVLVYDRSHTLSPDALRAILEAARWSPSAGNSQPWGFIVGLRGDDTHAAMVELLSSANQVWAPSASAIILTLHQVATDEDRVGHGIDAGTAGGGRGALPLALAGVGRVDVFPLIDVGPRARCESDQGEYRGGDF